MRPISLGRARRRRARRVRGLRQRSLDGALHLGDVERLADVVERARAHRFDRGVQRAESADEEHRTVRRRAERRSRSRPDCEEFRLMSETISSKGSRSFNWAAVRVHGRIRTCGRRLGAALRGSGTSPYRRRRGGCVSWSGSRRVWRYSREVDDEDGAASLPSLRTDPPCARATSRTIARPGRPSPAVSS